MGGELAAPLRRRSNTRLRPSLSLQLDFHHGRHRVNTGSPSQCIMGVYLQCNVNYFSLSVLIGDLLVIYWWRHRSRCCSFQSLSKSVQLYTAPPPTVTAPPPPACREPTVLLIMEGKGFYLMVWSSLTL